MRSWLPAIAGSMLALVGTEASTLVQSGEGNVTVTAAGAPAAGVDVFALINAGKKRLGTTSATGQLPFDPALLTGKVRVEVVVRECPDRREVVFVTGETDDACRDAERASEDEDEDCRCEPAGLIWWGSELRVDVVRLTASGGSPPLTSNPIFWTAVGGGGAATAIGLGTGGSDTTSTVPITTGGGTTTTSVPPMTTTSAPVSLTGTYEIAVTGVNDPDNHRPSTGDPPNRIEIVVTNGSFTADGPTPWVRVNGTIDAMGRFNATGRGTVAGRSGVMVIFEGEISMTPPHRLTGTYRMGTGGELPGGRSIDFFLSGEMR